MKHKNQSEEKKYDIEKMSDRLKMYKRTARRILRDRRVKSVLTLGTLIVALSPIAISALLGRGLEIVFSLVGVGERVTELVLQPSLVLFESVIFVLAVAPLVYGMRAYAARAAEGDAPTAETVVGFYSNPTYRSYSRRRAAFLFIVLLFAMLVFFGVSELVSYLGDRLVLDGDVARAAILYFGSLLALAIFAAMIVGAFFDRYLYTALFLRHPGSSPKALRARLDACMKKRQGVKREAITLNASFVGWFAVVFFTAGLAALYVVPYLMLTNAVCRSYLCRGSDA